MSLLVELFLLPINSTQSCCSLQSPLHVFFLIDLARQRVRLGLKKMMPVQNSLPHRATAGVGGAAHGGIGADLGEGEVLSMRQPGGVAEATPLAVVAAHTLRLTAMSKLSASSTLFLCMACLCNELLEHSFLKTKPVRWFDKTNPKPKLSLVF
jgi:hypothetical protein